MPIGDIVTGYSFSLESPVPLDDRVSLNTIAERDTLPEIRRYNLMIVSVVETLKTYQLVVEDGNKMNNSNWVEWFKEETAHSLGDHLDTSIDPTKLTNYQVLTWDTSLGKFVPKHTLAGLGIVIFDYTLTTVTNTPANGQVSRSTTSPITTDLLTIAKVDIHGETPSVYFADVTAGDIIRLAKVNSPGVYEEYNVLGNAIEYQDVWTIPVTWEVGSGLILPDDRVEFIWKTIGKVNWGNIGGTMLAQEDLMIEFNKHFKIEDHVETTSGSPDAGKPIKLNAAGKINSNLFSTAISYLVDEFIPTSFVQYPGTAGQEFGATWLVSFPNPNSSFTFTEGDLEGRTTNANDYMIYVAAGWILQPADPSANVYYRLDGTYAITQDFEGGGKRIKNIISSAPTDAATLKNVTDHTSQNTPGVSNPHNITIATLGTLNDFNYWQQTGTLISYMLGYVGINMSIPTSNLHVRQTVLNKSGVYFQYSDSPAVAVSTSNYNKVLNLVQNTNYAINSGITDSGFRMGLDISAEANSINFLGSLNSQYGIRVTSGYNNAGMSGTITNVYGLYLQGLRTGSTVVTNHYSIYSDQVSARMYHAGNLGIGSDNTLGIPLYLYKSTLGEILRLAGTGISGIINFYEGGNLRGMLGYGDAGSVFTGASADSLSIRATGNLHLGGGGDVLTMSIQSGKVTIGSTIGIATFGVIQSISGIIVKLGVDDNNRLAIYQDVTDGSRSIYNNKLGLISTLRIGNNDAGYATNFEGASRRIWGNYSGVESNGASDGFTGSGWIIDWSGAANASMVLDYLTIRKEMRIYSLEINRIRNTNGSLYVSDAGVIKNVTTDATHYTITLDTEIGNPFSTGDILRCQQWSATDVSTKYYELGVTSVVGLTVKALISAKVGTGTPAINDTINRDGHTTVGNAREGIVYITSSDTNSPYMAVVKKNTIGGNYAPQVRIGQLNGVTSANFGALTGYGFWAAGNAYLEGTIYSTAGIIGAWTLGANSLYSGGTLGSASAGIELNATTKYLALNQNANSHIKIYYTSGTDWGMVGKKDNVTYWSFINGAVYAKNATFESCTIEGTLATSWVTKTIPTTGLDNTITYGSKNIRIYRSTGTGFTCEIKATTGYPYINGQTINVLSYNCVPLFWSTDFIFIDASIGMLCNSTSNTLQMNPYASVSNTPTNIPIKIALTYFYDGADHYLFANY